ncbi:PE-PPE domain-containing protein [Mycolicibacterium gadium]|uniref:PE-PPE domain-containing protein n=1 Tax=Mycolicibacterium gadium TaxID=1794 RepID=UPI0013D6B4E6|nr:PE-PPE domain-containing protein [Mycolicibacterium gadium]
MVESGRKRAVKVAIGAAAVGVAASVGAVAVTQPASISASLLDLAALIVVGSSTNPSGEGVEDFYGGKFRDPMYTGADGTDIVRVNFREGPAGIKAALDANAGEQNAVISSGWGAANASLLLLTQDPAYANTVFILDNDVARPDGGFGTRYPWFALIGVNPIPTPSEVPAQAAVNVGYQYDYNSNAPSYVLNPFSAVNSLAAYLNTRLNQAEIDLPVNADGTPSVTCNANTCAITESGAVLDCPDARCSSPGDRITAYVTTRDNTTYVTYTTDELPLTALIRTYLGDYVADVLDPVLELLVNFGYYEGNPIPSDPSAYRPGAFLPSSADIRTTIAKIPETIERTFAAVVAPLQSSDLPAANIIEPTTGMTEAKPSIAEHVEQAVEVAAQSEYLKPQKPKLTKRPLLNVVRDGLKVKPGNRGDDDAQGIADTTRGDPKDGEGTVQSTDPPPSNPGEGGDSAGDGTEPGGSTGTNNDNGAAAAA